MLFFGILKRSLTHAYHSICNYLSITIFLVILWHTCLCGVALCVPSCKCFNVNENFLCEGQLLHYFSLFQLAVPHWLTIHLNNTSLMWRAYSRMNAPQSVLLGCWGTVATFFSYVPNKIFILTSSSDRTKRLTQCVRCWPWIFPLKSRGNRWQCCHWWGSLRQGTQSRTYGVQ